MLEFTHLIGIGLALTAAVSNALTQLFIRVGSKKGATANVVIVVMILNTVILTPIVLAVYYPHYHITQTSLVSFVLAGVLGSLFGRVFMYISIRKIGASRTAPLVSSQALFATILGIAFLGESLATVHFIGIVFVLFGIGFIAYETSNDGSKQLNTWELVTSLSLPFGAALMFGVEPIFATYGLRAGTAAPIGLVIKIISATVGFLVYLWWQNNLPDYSLLRDDSLKWFVIAGLANTVFLFAYYSALEVAPVNIVVPVQITSTLWIVILSALFMPRNLETVSWSLFFYIVIVFIGITLITLFG